MGNRPLKKNESVVNPATLHCMCCNKEYSSDNFYDSDSLQYKSVGKLPYCQNCIDEIYQGYIKNFKEKEYKNPEKKAVQRLCMAFDLYYNDKIFDNAMSDYEKNKAKSKNDLVFITFYFRHIKLYQYRKENYNSTIFKDHQEIKNSEKVMSIFNESDNEQQRIVNKASKFFGSGLSDDDYIYLQSEYDDWTARHECRDKSQEELIKQICFTQLALFKAVRSGDDSKVKDLNATLIKQMDAANLQPKQNKNNTVAETQTFGTLIEQWENTRPIPEVDKDLKDVDKIGLFLDVFFRGHLARMMGLKNGVSRYYDEYMKQFTVKKPKGKSQDGDEDTVEDDSEVIFDTLFGNSSSLNKD